ncbi:MAG: tetratricopeptide repeat protein, partial [Chloroflexi bacterium]|nr:tetratricopeptide repeat protein [Chloroflexota bacterium]
MARTIPYPSLTPADQLRHLLDASEKRSVSIKGEGADAAEELLQWLDRIATLLPELEAEGVDLRAERVRWEAVLGAVRRHEHELRAELAPIGGLKALRERQTTPPPPDHWWWWLDEAARERRKKQLQRFAITVIAIIVIFFVGRFVVNKLFPVDPNVIQSMELRNEGDRLIQEGDLQGAIAQYEAALAVLPDNNDTKVWLVVLYTLTQQPDKAAQLLKELEASLPPSNLHTSLAQVYIQLGKAEQAIPLAQAAISEDPQNPTAYLTLGSAYEALGDFRNAADQFELAAKMAEEQQQTEIQAVARIR